MSRIFSPYDLNPLRPQSAARTSSTRASISSGSRSSPIKLFVTATNVRTGRGRIFRNAEITADVLLASACLPTMFQAVEIDGEPYWDGGYAGNPTITPLVRESDAQRHHPGADQSARTAGHAALRDARSSIGSTKFPSTSPLMKELRMIALLRQVADPGNGEGARWAQMRTHRIMTDMLATSATSSKLNAEWEFLSMLRDEGRRAASDFLDAHARRSRQAFHGRSRRAAGGVLNRWACSASWSALGLLIWLAFRGWSVLLLAPARGAGRGAVRPASRCSRTGPRPSWAARRGFLAQFFPLFLLGALFGKLMDDSGSVAAIATS